MAEPGTEREDGQGEVLGPDGRVANLYERIRRSLAKFQPDFAGDSQHLARALPALAERRFREIYLGEWNGWKAGFDGTVDLTGIRLRAPNLRDIDLRGAILRDATFAEAVCTRGDLRDADLRGANFHGADLCDIKLAGADIRGADFRWARRCSTELFATCRGDATTVLPDGVDAPESWPADGSREPEEKG